MVFEFGLWCGDFECFDGLIVMFGLFVVVYGSGLMVDYCCLEFLLLFNACWKIGCLNCLFNSVGWSN